MVFIEKNKMACSKYNLTNTGSTIVTFNYQRCDDALWEYQVELLPNQTKNIWLLNNTYSSAFPSRIVLVNQGEFPSLTVTPTPSITPSPTPTVTTTPTNTPTNTSTPTPSVTAEVTPTPTQTQTQTPTPTTTQTPTNTSTPTPTPTVSRYSFTVTSGSTSNDACVSGTTYTIWGNNPVFDTCTQFYADSYGSSTMLAAFYANSGIVVEIDASGLPVGAFDLCSLLPTPTPTITSTATETPTPTPTTTPTATLGYYEYSLGSGATANDACTDFGSSPQTIYGSVAGGLGPNIGEILYQTPGNPPTNPVLDGYYSNGVAWWLVSGGSGEITSTDPNGC